MGKQSKADQMPPARMDDNFTGGIIAQSYKAGYINGRLAWYANDYGFYSTLTKLDETTFELAALMSQSPVDTWAALLQLVLEQLEHAVPDAIDDPRTMSLCLDHLAARIEYRRKHGEWESL